MQPDRQSGSRSLLRQPRALAKLSCGRAHALELIYAVCCLAGCPSLIDDFRNELVEDGFLAAIEAHAVSILSC